MSGQILHLLAHIEPTMLEQFRQALRPGDSVLLLDRAADEWVSLEALRTASDCRWLLLTGEGQAHPPAGIELIDAAAWVQRVASHAQTICWT